MKLTLPLAAALFVGSASLAAVQAIPVSIGDTSSGSVQQVAGKTAKAKKTGKTAKVKPKSGMKSGM